MREQESYPLALPSGSVLNGRYIVERVLGQGGFGITYMAREYRTKRPVAIKEYFPDTLAVRAGSSAVLPGAGSKSGDFVYGRQCFLEEAKTLGEFTEIPGIVRIHSYFEENNTAYFAMDYVEGPSFQRYLEERGGQIGWEETLRVLFPVMDALAAVHEKGIIHRDVTPDNMILASDGTVKLLDFGAARYSLGDRSESLDIVLKHGYAPREQYARHGRQGPYTDIYTLAATAYRAVTGRLPPDALDRIDRDELIPPRALGADLPAKAEAALLRALAVQPRDRFQTVREFRKALAAPESKPEPGLKPEPDVLPERRSGLSGRAALCAAGGVLFLAVSLRLLSGGAFEKERTEKTALSAEPVSIEAVFIETGGEEELPDPMDDFLYSQGVLQGYTGDELNLTIKGTDDGEEIRVIGKRAFSGNGNLTTVVLTEGVTQIEQSAFYQCGNLEEIRLPDSLETIGEYAFAECVSLREIRFGEGLTGIESYAFSNCGSLTSLTIPDSVASIGRCAFEGCSGLEQISIPMGCEVDETAFRRCNAEISYR
ncbi:MAG: leucine-rich repeat protein [Eubacteriales bacterium]|nr:leucine-rich repeat protein [Eubacteriales bacterium]